MHDDHEAPGPGHNTQPPAQWQTPHLPHGHSARHDHESEPDLDLVEAAFVEGFEQASDPTSFLRLAGIPFQTERDGQARDRQDRDPGGLKQEPTGALPNLEGAAFEERQYREQELKCPLLAKK